MRSFFWSSYAQLVPAPRAQSPIMKLFYTTTSCAKASFIAAHITGKPFEVEKVDLASHKTASGKDFFTINPKCALPLGDSSCAHRMI